MANILSFEKRIHIISALVEGSSIRSTARMLCVDKETVMHLGRDIGIACIKLHDRLVTRVHSRYIEIDEIWGFVGIHEKRKGKRHPPSFGDTYTFFAIDPESKLVPAYRTGKRSLMTATKFMRDLRSRVVGRPQMSVDGWPHWAESVRRTFGHNGVHLGSTVKEYQKEGRKGDPAGNYGRVKSQERTTIYGTPETELISTSIAERLNLTTRMRQRRLTRLTNAFSKKTKNLKAAMGLHFMHYNFVRVHEALGMTPAVAAGVTNHRWFLEELVREAIKEGGLPVPEEARTVKGAPCAEEGPCPVE